MIFNYHYMYSLIDKRYTLSRGRLLCRVFHIFRRERNILCFVPNAAPPLQKAAKNAPSNTMTALFSVPTAVKGYLPPRKKSRWLYLHRCKGWCGYNFILRTLHFWFILLLNLQSRENKSCEWWWKACRLLLWCKSFGWSWRLGFWICFCQWRYFLCRHSFRPWAVICVHCKW